MIGRNNPAIAKSTRAFTRLELLACVCAFALLTIVIAPALATSGSRNDRLACLNNLRQIANGLRQFALENNDLPPWRAGAEGGNYNDPRKHELWYQYWWLRDALKTPTILMDPAETRANVRVATRWDLNPNGGLQNGLYQNNAVAYVLNLDVTTFLPASLLVADRNIVHQGLTSCSSQISTAFQVWPNYTRWSGEIHGSVGNAALADGSVNELNADGLRRVTRQSAIAQNAHLMLGRW